MNDQKRTLGVAVALSAPFLGILTLHARHYLPFIADDALISLRYAYRLLEGHGLTWTEGHRVEGYSNLLWILLVALLGAFGVDLIVAARVAGIAGMALAMFALAWWYARQDPVRISWFPITLGLLFLALGAPIAIWAIGGLEQPLCAALIATSIPLVFSVLESEGDVHRARILQLSFVLGLLSITRPDGLLFTVTAALTLLGRAWIAGRAVRPLFIVLAGPSLLYGGQLLFRVLYYRELVPNTALVKLQPSPTHWVEGLNYVRAGLEALTPLSLLALASMVALLVSRRTRAKGVYLASTALVWIGYVVFIGGDIFPAYRHLVPLMIVMAFVLAEAGRLVSLQFASRRSVTFALAAIALMLCVPYSRSQFSDKQSRRAVRERWEWQGKELGLLLKSAFFRQRPLLAVTAAGCLPYWSKLPALDMMGLNDYYLPRHPPPDVGTGMIGHSLGDGQYVLSRQPDIIVFNVGSPPWYRTGDELNRTEAFHTRYVPVFVQTPRYDELPIVYVDRYSSKIGIIVSPSTILIPGFLLTGSGTVAQLGPQGKLVSSLPSGQSASIAFTAQSSNEWSLDHVRASRPSGITTELTREGTSLRLTLRAAGSDRIEVEQIVLKRLSQLAER